MSSLPRAHAAGPLAAAGLMAFVLAAPLAAQLGVGGDVTMPSRYVWRGVTRSQAVVVQPALFLATGGARDSLRAGLWTSWDLSTTRADQLSDRGPGQDGRTEANVWVMYQREQGTTTLAAGAIGYRFRHDGPVARRSDRWNTTELYGSVQARGFRFAPRLDAWWDVDRVRGWYFEASAGVPVLGNIEGVPFWAVYLRALAGYSAGQERNRRRPEELAYFASSGLTHVLFSVSSNFAIPGIKVESLRDRVTLMLDFNTQINRDRRTKVTSAATPPSEKGVKFWLSLTAAVPAARLF